LLTDRRVSEGLCAFAAAPALAVDFAYFEKQPCAELAKELRSRTQAEKSSTTRKRAKADRPTLKRRLAFC
jgi:hypothetical protein